MFVFPGSQKFSSSFILREYYRSLGPSYPARLSSYCCHLCNISPEFLWKTWSREISWSTWSHRSTWMDCPPISYRKKQQFKRQNVSCIEKKWGVGGSKHSTGWQYKLNPLVRKVKEGRLKPFIKKHNTCTLGKLSAMQAAKKVTVPCRELSSACTEDPEYQRQERSHRGLGCYL